MSLLLTGAAGFIGSHLAERLLALGHSVVGIDALVPYYPPQFKARNLELARNHPQYRFAEVDLRKDDLQPLLADVEVVFHLAAMPGLPRSWTHSEEYWSCNVLATERLLQACRGRPLQRFVYVSTSSVYGRFGSGDEGLPTKPISPYGVTKLAGEHLCRAYLDAFDLPVVVLRYFSVYGPRQRPDMGYHKFIQALLRDEPVTVFGDGQQVRGNTFVTDCIAATIAALQAPIGETYNVGGGETANVWDILRRLEHIAGRHAKLLREPARPGDQRYTFADTTKLQRHLSWQPLVSLDDGLRQQWNWQREQALQT